MGDSNLCLKESHVDTQQLSIPEDYTSAFKIFSGYCRQQLPSEFFIDFTLTCFDITANEQYAVFCGEYGNILNYHIPTSKVIRETTILSSIPIRTVLFILNDKQIIASNDYYEVYFIEYPTFEILYRTQMNEGPLTIKFNKADSTIFVSNFKRELKMIKVSEVENFYTENYELKKFELDENVFTYSICESGKLIGFGMESGVVKLVSAKPLINLVNTEAYSAPVNQVVFSKNNLYLAASFLDFRIKLWVLNNEMTLKYSEKTNSGLISNLSFISDDKYLLSSSFDGTLKLYNTQVSTSPYSMWLSDKSIISSKASFLENSIFYIQAPNSFMIWRVPEIPEVVQLSSSSSKIIKTFFIQGNFELLSISENGEITLWDYKTCIIEYTQALNTFITDAKLMINKGCVLCASNSQFLLWNFNSFTLQVFEYSFSILSFQIADSEDLLAVSDQYFRVVLVSFPELEKKSYLKGHLQPVTGCLFVQNDQFLFSCSKDCTIIQWNLGLSTRVTTMQGHTTEILHILYTHQNYLISGSRDGTIIIWSQSNTILYTLAPPEQEPVLRIFLSYYHEYLIILHPNHLNYWKLNNFSLVLQANTPNSASHFCLTNNEKLLALAANDTIYIQENPFESKSINVFGKSPKFVHKFMKFFLDSMENNSNCIYNPAFNQFVFVPYLIGSAHILAFCNKSVELHKSLLSTKNRASFFTSVQNESPLNICVDFEYKNCIDVCLKFIKKDSQGSKSKRKNIKAYVVLENCLHKLNRIEYPYISKLYEGLFVKIFYDKDVPKFCKTEANLPRVYLAQQLVIDHSKLVDQDMFGNIGRPIVFYQSVFALDLELGTIGSIDFLQSLLSCSDVTIFRSKLITEYLQYKWSKLKTPTYILSLIYLSYLTLLCLHILVYLESQTFLFILIQFHIFLVLYEVLQISTDFGDYWLNPWNILDQLRSISFTIYALLAWRGTYNTDLLLSVLIFSWTRGIACFRIFDETRYMVRLIVQVIIDITTFFLILFYATLAFAFIYYLRGPEKPFALYLTVAYRLNLGDFSTNFTSLFDWGIFLLATMINPLIMLNLLIAIMSDTASYVDSIDDICGWRELTQMILDMEKVMFWKKHLNVKNFLHKVELVEGGKGSVDKKSKNIAEIKRQVVCGYKEVKRVEKEVRKILENKVGHGLEEFGKGLEGIAVGVRSGLGAGKVMALDICERLGEGDRNIENIEIH